MDRFALYYPHIHVRDDDWLKYAALYWPKMARIRPPGYPLQDSPAARELHSARWLLDLEPPVWAAAEVAEPFLELIHEHGAALRDRFGLDRIETWGLPVAEACFGNTGGFSAGGDEPTEDGATWLNPRFGYVHASRVSERLLDSAVDQGLAVVGPGRGGIWVAMHPQLATVYMLALAEQVAAENCLHPITDQTLPHAVMSGWTFERLAVALLDDLPAQALAAQAPAARQAPEEAFAFLSFATVIPADLRNVPIEKILDIRVEFGSELDGFREFVADQVQRLGSLEDVRDAGLYLEYLHTEVDREVRARLDDLDDRMRGAGLETARALANVRSVALPPLAALAADAVGVAPALTVPAVVAGCVVGAPFEWRRRRREIAQESPVGYLFQLKRALGPDTLIDKLRRAWPL
ncbi:DUF6236 family protein [Streptomyces sp. NPDC048629]|uniref:DUF6236 family protein n=1 Tax=Streptomyces sp. NPDC048629 TaxID=3154824 RepID=UPI0034210FF2